MRAERDAMVVILRDLESYVRDLSEQTDSSAIDQLARLRRGYAIAYENARIALARLKKEGE